MWSSYMAGSSQFLVRKQSACVYIYFVLSRLPSNTNHACANDMGVYLLRLLAGGRVNAMRYHAAPLPRHLQNVHHSSYGVPKNYDGREG